MGFFSNWPFSNLHNLNLDWLIEQVKKLTVVSDQIWERVKPVPGGDQSTITAAQAYARADEALNSAARVGAEGAKTKATLNEHTENHENPHGVTPQQIGAEPKITLLEISKGGTGGFNPVTARASLGAREDFTILPVSDGGTGSSTPAGARSALGARADFAILPVSDGGTGSNTPEGACAALGAFPSAGGNVAGYINFGNMSNGLQWTCDDGTIIKLRPYVPANILQLTMTPSGGAEFGPVTIDSKGNITLSNLAIGSANDGLILKVFDNSCSIIYNKDSATKCTLSLNADGSAMLNGKKILTEA